MTPQAPAEATRQTRRAACLRLCVILGIATSAVTAAQSPRPVSGRPWRVLSAVPGLVADAAGGTVASVQFDLLVTAAADGGLMELVLPDGTAIDAAITTREAATGHLFVSGALVGGHTGEASLTVVGDTLSGRIVADGRLFLVRRHDGSNTHRFAEVDPAQFPPEAPPLMPPPPPVAAAARDRHPAGDSSAFVDVMVLYTPLARMQSGGVSAMTAEAVASVSLANVALSNSGAVHRLRLVHVAEATYAEDGSSATSLDRLTTTGDGYMDNVPALRNQYRADVVTLLTADTDACGVGWLMGPASVNASFDSHAFNVVSWSCAAGNLSLAHEIGHNMGLQHDRPNSGGLLPAASYAYGYYVAGIARDVMAYPAPCGCPRSAVFSSPLVNFPGIATPTPAGTATENATRALLDTAPVVANFRQSLVNTAAPPPADYDGDARSDLVFFRPAAGTWHVLRSGVSFLTGSTYAWGFGSDTPVLGDFDGDRKADLAVFRASSGTWYVSPSSSGFASYSSYTWGIGTDRPVAADYDGDRKTDVAVFRPDGGFWYILRSSTGFATYSTYQWGQATDVPVAADYDADGRADVAVFRPSTGMWFLLLSSSNYTQYTSYQWGADGDVPVPADYDGDGHADLAVFRPATGTWFIRWSASGYSTTSSYQWGMSADRVVPGDYDGDGRTDIAVFRPSAGTWYVKLSSTGLDGFVTYLWGTGTDTPLLARP